MVTDKPEVVQVWTIWISGKSYYAAVQPSGVPGAEGWPTPTQHRHGRGSRFALKGSRELAEQIASHLQEVGESFRDGTGMDAETRAEGRALLRDAQRIRQKIGAEP